METIEIQSNNKTSNLKKDEYARWLCLIEAIDLVERKAAELKQDMNNDDSWVKPLAFQKYIEQRFETMVLDVNREENFKSEPLVYMEKDIEVEAEDADIEDVDIIGNEMPPLEKLELA